MTPATELAQDRRQPAPRGDRQPRQRTKLGRYTPRIQTHDLLDAVRDIALRAVGIRNGEEVPDELLERARWCSASRWDRTRVNVGRLDVPTPSTIRRRFAAPWTTVMHAAFSPVDDRGRILGWLQRHGGPRRVGVTGGPVVGVTLPIGKAIRMVAYRLGRPPTAIDYERVAAQLQAERLRRWSVNVSERFPNSRTIISQCGSWEAALEQAAVPVPAPETGTQREVRGLDECIDEIGGLLPTQKYFREWAARKGLRLPDRHAVGRLSWNEICSLVAQARAAQGKEMPREGTAHKALPPLADAVVTRRTGAPVTEEQVLVSLRLYAERELQDGRRPLSKHYQAAAVGNPDLVSFHAMQRFGTWQELCRKAGIA